jgi:hypothetical protein
MALIGFEAERQKIADKMAEIRRQLGQTTVSKSPSVDGAKPRRKRKMSAAGKRNIREALKKRWAAYHAKQRAGK